MTVEIIESHGEKFKLVIFATGARYIRTIGNPNWTNWTRVVL